MRSSTAAALIVAALILGYAFGAFSSPVTQYIYTTITETFTTSATITYTVTATTIGGGEVEGVCFSAVEDCSSVIQLWISRANHSIHAMIYSFTQDELGKALAMAVEKGVKVAVIFEEDQLSKYSELERLKEAGAEVYIDGNPNAMHHKVAIIDGKVVITGSYNWSRSAEEKNDENLIILVGEEIARLYEKEFQRVRAEAIPA